MSININIKININMNIKINININMNININININMNINININMNININIRVCLPSSSLFKLPALIKLHAYFSKPVCKLLIILKPIILYKPLFFKISKTYK